MADDRVLSAFMIAICDTLATYRLELRALVLLLEQKGAVTFAEYEQQKAAIPPERYSAWAAEIRSAIEHRMAELIAKLESPGIQ